MPSRPHVLTVRLSAAERRRLQALAEREGVGEEEAARRAIASATPPTKVAESDDDRPSVADLMGDLMGCVEGPPDLSTIKAYMEGFGESRRPS
ncbi:MAG: hypothetical protein AAF791_13980 [Bacteroidota bacterium]